MTLLKNTRIQHLILKYKDQKPTFPDAGVNPGDASWRDTDILVGEWAYNKKDDIWYYNNGEKIKPLNPPSETLTTDNVSLYDPAKPEDDGGYAYYAGNTYVTYKNEDSSDSQFHDEAIYRCVEDALKGESPETHPSKWEHQGTEVVSGGGILSNIFFDGTSQIKAITDYKDGNNVVDKSTGVIYRYNKDATTGLQPNDNNEDTGRWVEDGKIIFEAPEDGKPYIRKNAAWEEMPKTGLPSTWEANAADIRALTDHDAGMDVGNYATGAVYEYDETSTASDDGDTILKPDDVDSEDSGRWVKEKTFVAIESIREESEEFTVTYQDGNTQIRYTGATDISVTIPNTLRINEPITITQAGAGVVTLVGDTDVTVNSLLGLKTPGQGGHIQAWKVKDNVIDTAGGVA